MWLQLISLHLNFVSPFWCMTFLSWFLHSINFGWFGKVSLAFCCTHSLDSFCLLREIDLACKIRMSSSLLRVFFSPRFFSFLWDLQRFVVAAPHVSVDIKTISFLRVVCFFFHSVFNFLSLSHVISYCSFYVTFSAHAHVFVRIKTLNLVFFFVVVRFPSFHNQFSVIFLVCPLLLCICHVFSLLLCMSRFPFRFFSCFNF